MPYRLSVAAHAVATLIGGAYERRFQLPLPQWRVMTILNEHGQMRQQDIVPLSTMDKQTVSRAVRVLRARGLLTRRVHRDDGRAWTLRLTAAGRRLYAQVAPLALRFEQDLQQGMSTAERAALALSLQRLQDLAGQRLALLDGEAR